MLRKQVLLEFKKGVIRVLKIESVALMILAFGTYILFWLITDLGDFINNIEIVICGLIPLALVFVGTWNIANITKLIYYKKSKFGKVCAKYGNIRDVAKSLQEELATGVIDTFDREVKLTEKFLVLIRDDGEIIFAKRECVEKIEILEVEKNVRGAAGKYERKLIYALKVTEFGKQSNKRIIQTHYVRSGNREWFYNFLKKYFENVEVNDNEKRPVIDEAKVV